MSYNIQEHFPGTDGAKWKNSTNFFAEAPSESYMVIQAGAVTLSGGKKAVTFGTAFSAAPKVFVSSPINAILANDCIKLSSIGTTGFTVAGSTTLSTATCNWFAIGTRA